MLNLHPSNCRAISKFCFIILFLIFANTPLALSNGIKLISFDQHSVTLELTVSELKTDVKEIDSIRYQSVSYPGCGFTSEAGNPSIPVSRTFVGVPPDATFRIEVMNAVSSLGLSSEAYRNQRVGYRLPPVPHQVIKRNKTSDARLPEVQSIVGKFVEDGVAYQENAFYPKNLAEVVYEGYIRDQRVINVELCPVQYNPKTRSLKFYSRILARVIFDEYTQAAPSIINRRAHDVRGFNPRTSCFENFFRKNLINYDNAKNWRKTRPQSINAAPALENGPVYKIYVEETGIYRLTYEELKNDWGVDLSELDPRNLRMRLRGNEIPIYVHGESDGKFNEGDYIEFFGEDPNAIYTRWNVYWLDAPQSPLPPFTKGGLGGF